MVWILALLVLLHVDLDIAYPHTPKTLITNVRMGDVETGDALVKNNALLLAVL